MSANNQVEENIIEGVPPTKAEQFYGEWGRETLKENISTLNDMFKLFITLDTILLSAYLGFFDKASGDLPSLSWQTISPAIFVLLSMVSSIIGIYPFSLSVNLASPDEIRHYKDKRSKFKSRCLGMSAITLVCGFVILLIARIVTIPGAQPALQFTVTPSP